MLVRSIFTTVVLASTFALTGCAGDVCEDGFDCGSEGTEIEPENVATAEQALESWLTPISEETGPAYCPANTVMAGANCTGSFCDNVSLLCRTATGVQNNYAWTTYFSEEGTYYRYCNSGFVSGLQCSGRYCDNMRLECVSVSGAARSPCYWTGWFSDEHGPTTVPEGYGVAGMACKESYCDDIKLYYCKL